MMIIKFVKLEPKFVSSGDGFHNKDCVELRYRSPVLYRSRRNPTEVDVDGLQLLQV